MSKNERLKAQIDYLKAIVLLLLTALFAIIGWIVTVRKSAEAVDLILVGFGIILLSIIIYVLNGLVFKKLDELEKLKDKK